MDCICKVCNLLHFVLVELALVDTVSSDVVAELSAGELMEYHSVFTEVDDFAVVQRCKFLKELVLFYECLEHGENLFVHLLSCIIIREPRTHRNGKFLNTFCTCRAAQCFCDRNRALQRLELFKAVEFVQVVPRN